jgi:hypothetical protein
MATTITANGINFPDGSASAPSIGGTDTNTGLFTGSDLVGFATGGTERLRIKADGKIEIPTTGKLSLGMSSPVAQFTAGTANGSRVIEIQGTDGVIRGFDRNSSAWAEIAFEGASYTFDTGGSEKLRITSDGRIGVGTSPHSSYRFDIRHTSNAYLHLGQGDATLGAMANNTWNALSFQGTNAELGLFKDSSGNYSYIMGTYQGGTAIPVVFRTGNRVERLRITSDGKVCINNDTALSDLHICTAGSGEEDGTLRIGGTVVSLGLVLDYDQSNATVSRITANPTYTNDDSLLKICVDGDANPNQLVLRGDGNIGIGINDTSANLQIVGSNSAGLLRVGGNQTQAVGLNISYDNSSATTTTFKQNYRASNAGALIKFDSGYFTFHAGTAGGEKLRITSTGDIGINCTPHSNAGINLQIHGDNTTSEIRLTNTTTGSGNNGGTIQMGGNTLYISNSENDNTIFENNGHEVARFNSNGGLQLSNTGCNRGIIWIHDGEGGESCQSMANVQQSGGRGIINNKMFNIAANTTTDFAKSHWGGLCLIGWAGTGHQGSEQVMFGYNQTPSSRYKAQWQGNLTVTYTMSAYTLRISHNASNALNFWCILIGF